MARYVDGFLIPVPKRKLSAYRRISARAGRIWMDHGALEYIETAGDDLEVKGMASFARAARVKPGETVVFSWIVYRSRAHRDRVNRKIMEDPRLVKMMKEPALFDTKRMAYAGFRVLVELVGRS